MLLFIIFINLIGIPVTSSLLEIIELANGDIALKRAGEDEDALVTIRFSDEANDYIGDAGVDVAKVMIQAGVQAVEHINEARSAESDRLALDESFEEGLDYSGDHTLH